VKRFATALVSVLALAALALSGVTGYPWPK